jgi:hypothetical protein
VFEQQLSGLRGFERAAAHDEHRAHLGLQRTQALRHRRLCDGQPLSGALKAPFLNDGREAFQRVRIEGAHGLLY